MNSNIVPSKEGAQNAMSGMKTTEGRRDWEQTKVCTNSCPAESSFLSWIISIE